MRYAGTKRIVVVFGVGYALLLAGTGIWLWGPGALPQGTSRATEGTTQAPGRAALSVADFLPMGYRKDGSVSYQKEVQTAIDTAARAGGTLVFPAMVYQVDESGWQVRSGMTLSLYGAVFRLDERRQKDGHVFVGRDVTDMQFLGGEIVGRNDVWPEGVNIRGIYLTGAVKSIRIRDLRLRGLSSNGIGIFGDSNQRARDVWVTDVVIENCCNRYGDYLSATPGPEKGSVREDQGLIAFYRVEDFVVRGCRLEKSRSDGTHFYRCRRGQFVHNRVYAAQMGGYFIETCEDVLASDNIIRDNGSRGCTIERGSKNCTLRGNVVDNSGREGLWAPDCTGLIVTGNVFDRNGRKPNGKKATQVWNANITVNHDPSDPTKSPTQDYLIADNLFYTTASQVAAIRVDAAVATGIVVRGNLLRGENQRILVEGDRSNRVFLQNNSE
jgi:parallel beta-helix repeat protein